MSKIEIDEFADEIIRAMSEYADVIVTDMKEEIDNIAKEAVKKVKDNSPKREGSYKKNWRSEVLNNNAVKKTRTVFNKKHYYLTHLLENGHEYTSRDGKRKTAPIAHIRPAEEWTVKEIENRIKRRISS